MWGSKSRCNNFGTVRETCRETLQWQPWCVGNRTVLKCQFESHYWLSHKNELYSFLEQGLGKCYFSYFDVLLVYACARPSGLSTVCNLLAFPDIRFVQTSWSKKNTPVFRNILKIHLGWVKVAACVCVNTHRWYTHVFIFGVGKALLSFYCSAVSSEYWQLLMKIKWTCLLYI